MERLLSCKKCHRHPVKRETNGEISLGCCIGAAWGKPIRYWTVINSWNRMQMEENVLHVAEGRLS
jgi:hypothetical protein